MTPSCPEDTPEASTTIPNLVDPYSSKDQVPANLKVEAIIKDQIKLLKTKKDYLENWTWR